MKLLKLLWVLLLVPITTHAANLEKELVDKLLNATVRVVSYTTEIEAKGVGAGVIISESGLILTNYHVIHGAIKVKVYLRKDRMRTPHIATIKAIDPVSDLALLDIDPWPEEVFYPVELEDNMDNMYVGSEVIAVGHPLRLPWTVTKGIINYINRPSFITPYVFLIQHDAIINQGNSGGPLFNLQGNLIGINTYMIAPEGKYSGMGYAVQIDTVAKSLTQMMELGEVIRPAMRLNLLQLNDDVRNFILDKEDPDPYVPNSFGMIMNFIEPDSHADKQGMKNFDVIVSVDGYPINDMRDIQRVMYDKKPGELIYLLVNRKGEFILIPFVLETLELADDFYDEEEPTGDVPPDDSEEKDLEDSAEE